MLDLHSVSDWTKGQFTMRSGFYAGRGPSRTDLNPRILEMLYQGIKQTTDAGTAANFVRFVNKLDDLSASAFIVAFEQFAAQDGKVVEIEQRRTDRNMLDSGDGMELQAFAVIAETMFGGKRDPVHDLRASNDIKFEFIRDHLSEIPEDERRKTANPYDDPFGRHRR